MKNLSILKYVVLSFIVSMFTLEATVLQDTDENVIRRSYTSIAQIKEGKAFLKPEKLYLKEGIIYIEDMNGEELAVPVMFPSQGRPFMQVSESIVFNSWLCECNTWNHNWDNPTHCWKCRRPR